jgi:hypothetical protein
MAGTFFVLLSDIYKYYYFLTPELLRVPSNFLDDNLICC